MTNKERQEIEKFVSINFNQVRQLQFVYLYQNPEFRSLYESYQAKFSTIRLYNLARIRLASLKKKGLNPEDILFAENELCIILAILSDADLSCNHEMEM